MLYLKILYKVHFWGTLKGYSTGVLDWDTRLGYSTGVLDWDTRLGYTAGVQYCVSRLGKFAGEVHVGIVCSILLRYYIRVVYCHALLGHSTGVLN